MYLRELSRSKFHSVTNSNVILYNDAKNSIFIKSGFNTFLEMSSFIPWTYRRVVVLAEVKVSLLPRSDLLLELTIDSGGRLEDPDRHQSFVSLLCIVVPVIILFEEEKNTIHLLH